MNALDRKIVNAGNGSAVAWFLGVAAATILLSGCSGFPIASVKVDPDSPIAPEVARVAKEGHTYPSFNDIPPQPTDIRQPKVYGERANDVLAARAQLDAATQPNTWTLGNTQGFVNRARAAAGPNYTPPAGGTEAFADTVRKRATPPPPTNP
jgi:hypothetical protein